jgi:hypothetical protein
MGVSSFQPNYNGSGQVLQHLSHAESLEHDDRIEE